jgi:hypothetical protein
MAEIKHLLKQLRKQKKVALYEVRRILRMLVRHMPYSIVVVTAPRPSKRAAKSIIRFEVGGNVTRSVILALPNVHLNGISLKTIAAGAVIIIAVVTAVTTVTPYTGKNVLPPFEQGDPYRLDVVIAPYHVAGLADEACTKFARDLAIRIANKLVNQTPDSTSIWTPDQVSNSIVRGLPDETNASLFASEKKVDLVFYGDMTCDGQDAIIRPRVHASTLFYAGAPEMAGLYNFDDMTGQIKMPMNNGTLEQAANQQIIHAIELIDIGRGFKLNIGDSDQDLKKASDLFMQLANASVVTDRHGQAMLWYMAGRSQFAGVLDKCETVDPNQLTQAEKSFLKSLQHEPELALAHAYLGNISIYQTRYHADSGYSNADLLNKSLARFERALHARVQPASDLAVLLASLGKAQAQILLYDMDPTGAEGRVVLADAIETLNEVVRKIDESSITSKELQSITAHAYALLGDVQHAQLKEDWALSSYSKASLLTSDSRLKTAVSLSLAELYTARGDACQAAEQYRTASQTLCERDKREFALQAQHMQFYCQQTNDAMAR